MRVYILAIIFVVFASSACAYSHALPFAESEHVVAQQESPTPSASPATNGEGVVAVPEPSERAMSYYRSGVVLWIINIVLGLLIPALFLFTGFSARIRDWAQKLGRGKWFFVIAIYFIIFTLINFVIGLPLAYYEEFARQHAYGLSNQTFAKWFGDTIKSLVIGLITGALFLWIPYLLLKRSPRRWWLYTSLLAIPFICLVLLVVPVWIDPLFNDFGPMQNRALEARILQLAERAGIEGSRVYEVNKSVDTETVNAYVTGFMSTKRIVLWDTIIAKLDEDELLFVMGHEMGHYVLNHVAESIAVISVLIFIALYAAHRLAHWFMKRFSDRFGFNQLSDIASLPLLLLVISIISLVVSPMMLAYSRHREHEADRFALEITRSNRAGATAFVKLQTENLSNPRPGKVMKFLRSTHPPPGERIDFCNIYRPWDEGVPLRYGHLFRDESNR